MLGIEQARPGNRLGDIGHAIQSHAEAHRYGVVRDFCGHGLGRVFHDAPEVVHAGRPGTGPELRPGMFFTIEPMINIGKADCKVLDDGWTAVTRDRSLSAQFEHSIGITEDGCEIFTKSPKGSTRRLTPEPHVQALRRAAQRLIADGPHPAIGHELAEEDDARLHPRRRCRSSAPCRCCTAGSTVSRVTIVSQRFSDIGAVARPVDVDGRCRRRR